MLPGTLTQQTKDRDGYDREKQPARNEHHGIHTKNSPVGEGNLAVRSTTKQFVGRQALRGIPAWIFWTSPIGDCKTSRYHIDTKPLRQGQQYRSGDHFFGG